MKADGEILAMIDANLKLAVRNKSSTEEKLLELQSSRNAEFIHWMRLRLEGNPEIMERLQEEGILDAAIARIGELSERQKRLRQAIENDRGLATRGMLAANALHSSGGENARLPFPISAAALQSIRIGEGCGDVLREVIETAKTTQPPMFQQNQAIPRPRRFPAMR